MRLDRTRKQTDAAVDVTQSKAKLAYIVKDRKVKVNSFHVGSMPAGIFVDCCMLIS